MVFSSNIFLFFYLPVVLTAYYICPIKFKNLLLLLVSLVFYGWGEPKYLLLMLFTIALNYISGLLIGASKSPRAAKNALIVSICLNLSILGFFKYASFLVETFNLVLPAAKKITVPDIPLPVGISFYVFQSMSYTIDVYRKDAAVQKNAVDFGTYIALFPQLIAGPIVRYSDIELQLRERKESLSKASEGVTLFIIGLAKKMLIANKMGSLFSALSADGGALSAWVCIFASAFQIYFDFSGYSDMAIGLGKMMGFEFLKNFDYPFISQSVTELWHRWHISLSTWFREYVYFPLGGNRKGHVRQLLNIVIVWGLTGLWHGASWNFVFWGLYHALLLIADKLFLFEFSKKLPKPLRIVSVFVLFCFGLVLFSFTDLQQSGRFFVRLFSLRTDNVYALNIVFAYLPTMLAAAVAATPLPCHLYHKLDGSPVQSAILILWMILLFVLCVAALASQSYNPFIYFRF